MREICAAPSGLMTCTGPVRVPSLNSGPDYDNLHLPVAEKFCSQEQVVLPHHWLLADKSELAKLVSAIEKVKQHAEELTG